MKFNLTSVYGFFGGFGEFCTVISLLAAITLTFEGKLTGSYAGALTAINGFGIIHDQLSQYQDDRKRIPEEDLSKHIL